jgi:hypothetical protein
VAVTTDYVTDGIRNYYINGVSVTGVHGYRQLTYTNLYSDIDLVITNKGNIIYKFIVKDGGNPQDIRFKFSGADSAYIDTLGNIIVQNPLSDINLPAPAAKKDISGVIVSIGSSFSISTDTFSIATASVEAMSIAINHIRLIPVAITQDWTTRVGETNDRAFDIKMDDAHNKYVTGTTLSDNFPIINSSVHVGTGTRAFLFKFDANDHPVFATLFGGTSSGQWVEGLALGVSKISPYDIFMTGEVATSDIPLVNPGGGALQRAYGGTNEPYIVELDQSGNVVWFTYCGGDGAVQAGTTLTIDNQGGNNNVYIGGWIDGGSLDFPLVPPADLCCPYAYYNDHNSTDNKMGFIQEFNSSRELIYSTFVAPSADDGYYYLRSLRADSQGNLIVFGETNCTAEASFPNYHPVTGEYTQSHYSGNYDYLIMKLNPYHELLWSSYFGGAGYDGFSSLDAYPLNNCLTIDNADNFYLTGETKSLTLDHFPVTDGSTNAATGAAGFVAKFSTANHQLWTTYFAGLGSDDVDPAAITYNNERNEIFIAGQTTKTYFYPGFYPHVIFGAPYGGFDQSEYRSNRDGFFAMFDGTSHVLKWSTCIGGYNEDFITGLTSSDNELAFSGHSTSIDVVGHYSFPLRNKGNGAYWYNTYVLNEQENAIVGAFQICNSPLCMAINRPALEYENNVKQNPVQDVNIFPNPSTGIITIAFAGNNTDKDVVEVFNIFGQKIVERKSLQNNTRLDLSSYPKGLYLIKVTSGDRAITSKVVLE